jgi:hypothetical protein
VVFLHIHDRPEFFDPNARVRPEAPYLFLPALLEPSNPMVIESRDLQNSLKPGRRGSHDGRRKWTQIVDLAG